MAVAVREPTLVAAKRSEAGDSGDPDETEMSFDRAVTFACNGHPSPWHRRRNGCSWLRPGGVTRVKHGAICWCVDQRRAGTLYCGMIKAADRWNDSVGAARVGPAMLQTQAFE